jgi:hypothetical protein
VPYWLKAAELALARSAHKEADRYIDAGLALIPRLTDGPDRQSLELALRVARTNTLVPLKGYTASETVEALTGAKQLLDAGVGTDLQLFSVLYGLWAASFVAAGMEPALALARRIVEVADRHDDTTYRLLGYRILGATQLNTGQNRAALESVQRAERYRDPVRQRLLSYRFGFDPGLAMLCYKIWALMFLGVHNQAERVREQVWAELPSHSHAPTLAICNLFASVWPELAIGNFEACERHSVELVTFSTERKLESSRLLGAKFYTCARAMREPTRENIAASRAAMDAEHRSGTRIFDSAVMSRLAEALLTSGDATAAEAAVQEAFGFVDQSGERFWLADLHRVQGQIALKRRWQIGRGRKLVSSKRLRSPAARTPACSNCAPRPISPSCAATRGRTTIPAHCWSQSSRKSRAARP